MDGPAYASHHPIVGFATLDFVWRGYWALKTLRAVNLFIADCEYRILSPCG